MNWESQESTVLKETKNFLDDFCAWQDICKQYERKLGKTKNEE